MLENELNRPLPQPIDARTRIFAVLGNPIAHSLSPAMQNFAFNTSGFHGVLVALQVADISQAVAGIRGLGLGGVAVTIPHKVSIIPYLDTLDPLAEAIGAVNTVMNKDGYLTGYNSDCEGAIKALLDKTEVQGKRVAIIGAGGAARAVGFGVNREKGEMVIFNRTRARGEALAEALNARYLPLSEIGHMECDILINASSVGMHPNGDYSPIPEACLTPGMVVMDLVYNPLKTRLIKEAEKRGCAVIDGLAMFVRQGAFQFELWTGLPAPVAGMRETVYTLLTGRKEQP
jgi:shikimate dehydrogenase